MNTAGVLLLTAVALASCSGGGSDEPAEAEARAVPMTQSAAARALRLPRMRLARVMRAVPGTTIATLRVTVQISGTSPADTTVQARSVDAACTESFVDTVVARRGDAIAGALVWIEGAGTVFSTAADGEHRPTVILEQCQLRPRVQLAEPGSTIQLVMRDARVEQLVVVPASLATPIDTVSFIAEGQLVPIQHRTDSSGVLGVYANKLPWARSFVAVAPNGVTAVTDTAGVATFTVDRAAKKVTVRAWHPSLGVVAVNVDPSEGGAEQNVTLTFRR